MSNDAGNELRELLQKEESMRYYQRRIGELEEDNDRYQRKVKKQQEELEDCYSADVNFTELLDEIQTELRGKEILEEEIFKDMKRSIETNLENMKEQRKQIE